MKSKGPSAARISIDEPSVADKLRAALVARGIDQIDVVGDPRLLSTPPLAILCSARTPGAVTTANHRLMQALRGCAITVAGGFQSPHERQCLETLMGGRARVVVWIARRLHPTDVPDTWLPAIGAGDLTVACATTAQHLDARAAANRNALVATHARWLLVPHAEPGGRLHKVLIGLPKPTARLFTTSASAGVVDDLGAERLDPTNLPAEFGFAIDQIDDLPLFRQP